MSFRSSDVSIKCRLIKFVRSTVTSRKNLLTEMKTIQKHYNLQIVEHYNIPTQLKTIQIHYILQFTNRILYIVKNH